MSLINGQLYGILAHFVLHCGCSMQAGCVPDAPSGPGSGMIEFYYSSYFFIKVTEKVVKLLR